VDLCAVIKYKKKKKALPLSFQECNCHSLRQAAVFVIKCNIFNVQGSFILPVIYFARACKLQVSHARFSMMDGLALHCTVFLPHCDVTDEMVTVNNCNSYFVFMTAAVENPVSHKYFVTKGSKTFTALFGKLG
jgi:hypothetical protein